MTAQQLEQLSASSAGAALAFVLVSTASFAFRLGLQVLRNLGIAASVVPAVLLQLEELLQHLLHRLPLLLRGGSHQPARLLDVGRYGLLIAVVEADQSPVGAVFEPGEVRGGAVVVAEVVLVVVHAGLQMKTPRSAMLSSAIALSGPKANNTVPAPARSALCAFS